MAIKPESWDEKFFTYSEKISGCHIFIQPENTTITHQGE
jgi:hypothetical protein